jgi:hypothetical protein
MKKVFVILFLLALMVQPARAQVTQTWSAYYSTGYKGYETLLQGYVHAAVMTYAEQQEGLYTRVGNAFVTPYPVWTHISGTCSQYPVMASFSAILNVDNENAHWLFSNNTGTGTIDFVAKGEFFAVKVFTTSPVTCSLLFEALE